MPGFLRADILLLECDFEPPINKEISITDGLVAPPVKIVGTLTNALFDNCL